MVINMNVYLQKKPPAPPVSFMCEIIRPVIRPEFSAHADPGLSVWWITGQAAGITVGPGAGGRGGWVGTDTCTHRANVNKKIVSSHKSNPLASRSHMCHRSRVSLSLSRKIKYHRGLDYLTAVLSFFFF